MPLVVAVTGGIGSGKTVVAEAFAGLGVEVIDTDQLAHQLTAPGEPALREIARQFGAEVLSSAGGLDRAQLRKKVFADPDARRRLEALLHPLIRQGVDRLLKQARGPYVILVVPLLVETGGYSDVVDRVLVVDCPEETQIARAMRRSGLSRDEVEAILRAQATREQRLAGADDVLSNAGDLDNLRRGVERLHREYLALAGGRIGR
jgi:dephospho-CoA kinase